MCLFNGENAPLAPLHANSLETKKFVAGLRFFVTLLTCQEQGPPAKNSTAPLPKRHRFPSMNFVRWMDEVSKRHPSKLQTNATRLISAEELAAHCHANDCWLAIEGNVYDVGPFLRAHPGGTETILEWAGRDATAAFTEAHPWVHHVTLLEGFFMGKLHA